MISKLSLRDVYIVWSFQFTVNYLGKLVVVVRHITSVACWLLSLLLISYTWRAKLCSDSRMDFFFFFLWQTVILESIRVGLDQLYVTSKMVHGNFWVMCTVWKMFWNMHTTVTRNCLTLLFLNSLKCLQPCCFLPCKLQHYISDVCCFAFFHSSDWGFSLWDALTYRAAVFPAVHVPLALISEKSQS